MTKVSASRRVPQMLGALLLVAAGLKLRGLVLGTASAGGFFSSSAVTFAIAEGEIILGAWFLVGKNPIGVWLTSFILFVSFAGVSFYQGLIGQASCGCFGSVKVNPWLTFSLDVGVVAALLLGKPDLSQLREMTRAEVRRQATAIGGAAGGAVLVLAILLGMGYYAYGSPDAALAHLRGQPIAVAPGLLDLGRGMPGEERETDIAVVNWTDKPVRIIGAKSSCSCVLTHDLPITLQPRESRNIVVHFRFMRSHGSFTQRAFLLADDDRRSLLPFRLTGRVVPE